MATKREKPKHKRPSPEQSIPLAAHTTIEGLLKVDPDSPEAKRQRVRDRSGDEPPPRGTGRPRK